MKSGESFLLSAISLWTVLGFPSPQQFQLRTPKEGDLPPPENPRVDQWGGEHVAEGCLGLLQKKIRLIWELLLVVSEERDRETASPLGRLEIVREGSY